MALLHHTHTSMLLSSLLLLVLLPSSVLCIPSSTFDLSLEQDCLAAVGGCSFSNSTIWLDHAVPSGAEVFITGSGNTTTPLLIYITSSMTQYSFTIKNAVLEVRGENGTEVVVQWGVALSGSSTLSLLSSSFLTNSTTSPFTLESSSTLTTSSNTSFSWQGNAEFYGSISIDATSTIALNNVTYFPTISNIASLTANTITIPIGASNVTMNAIKAHNLTVSVNATLTTNQYSVDQLNIQEGALLNLLGSTVYLNGSTTTGSGKINVANGYVELFNGTLNATLELTGTTTITATSVKVYNLIVGLPLNTITVIGDALELAGNGTAYASIIAVNRGITFSNFLNLVGSLVVNQSSSITITKTLVIASGSSIAFNNNTSLHLSGLLVSDTLEIPPSCSLNSGSANGTVQANVVNRGSLNVSSVHNLYIHGHFAQTEEGITSAILSSTTTASLFVVNSTVQLNGALNYKMTQEPFKKSATYPVLSAVNSTINGTFVGSATALPGSTISRALAVQYKPNLVSVVYGFHAKDVQEWVWIVFVVVCAIIVISTIAVCYKCTRRHEYEPIR